MRCRSVIFWFKLGKNISYTACFKVQKERLLVLSCRAYLSVVVVCCWLSNVGFRVMPVGCPVSLSVGVVGFGLSGVGCQYW
jgi:hypothetical protein